VQTGDSAFGMPYLINPDPQPVIGNGWNGYPGSSVNASNLTGINSYMTGDPTAQPQTTMKSWFRIYRLSGARFVVTCGSGGTMGYQRSEVLADTNAIALFNNDIGFYDNLSADELKLWYLVEWNAASMALDYHMIDQTLVNAPDHYVTWPQNASQHYGQIKTQLHAVNMGGTILWIQRLLQEPTNW
jgi:hypothetical protein